MNRSERRQSTVRPSQTEVKARAQRRNTIVIASLVVIAIGLIAAVIIVNRNGSVQSASNAPDLAPIKVGDTAPPFSVATTNGPFDSTKAGGKPTLLEAFATWCPHCQREVPVMNALNTKYKGKANVVGVSASPYAMDGATPESQADVVTFMTKLGVTYPVAFDPNLDVAHKYLQGGFPTVVLIGADGKIQAIGSGEIAAKDLQKAIDDSLAGKPVNPAFSTPKK